MAKTKEMIEIIDDLLQIVGYHYDGNTVSANSEISAWIAPPEAFSGILTPVAGAEIDFVDENANKRIFINADKDENMILFATELMKRANAPWYHEFPEWQIFYAKDGKRDSWFWYRTHALFVKISKNGQIKGNRISGPVLNLCEGNTLSVEKLVGTLTELSDSKITQETLQNEVPAVMSFLKKRKLI